MVTKTTAISSDYTSLFEEIYEKSNHAIKVDTLEQFFGSIQEIAALDRKFLRLPLDEPMFVIDANTRKINVDATPFKANGLSVQGDHFAETVFFKIDRYYDTMDLMNTNIYINWKMGSESARDICSIKSDSIIPGYVVFGWSVHDLITAKSGSLQFSISLEIEQDGVKAYALNTIPATLNIKEGLVLTNPQILDMKNNITSILINSSFSDGTAAIGEVKWASGDGNGLVKELNGEFAQTINLVANANEDELTSVPVTLYALAAAGRDAVISYSDSNKTPMASTYLLVDKASVLHDDVIYYVEDLSATKEDERYQIASQSQIEAFETDPDIATPLYVAVAEVVLDKVGSYIVNAQGVKYETRLDEKNEEYKVKIGASSLVECTPVEVPGAETPSDVIIAIPEREYDPNYNTEAASPDTIFLAENTELELTASAQMQDNNDFGLLNFIWEKDGVEEAVQEDGFKRENSSTLKITDEGSYSVKVEHYRNGDEKKTAKSKTYLVSYFASPLEAEIEPINDTNLLELVKTAKGAYTKGSTGTVVINYTFATENPYSSSIKADLIHKVTEDEEVVMKAQFSEAKDGIINCTINSADITADGRYFFRVYNIYNGSIFSDDTSMFIIDIKE